MTVGWMLVKHKRHAAVSAPGDKPAGFAEHMIGIAASIDEKNDLLFLLQSLLNRILQLPGKNAAIAECKFLTHVDHH